MWPYAMLVLQARARQVLPLYSLVARGPRVHGAAAPHALSAAHTPWGVQARARRQEGGAGRATWTARKR